MHTIFFIRIIQQSLKERIQGSTHSHLTSDSCHNAYKPDKGVAMLEPLAELAYVRFI
jgi:hypothetical protein